MSALPALVVAAARTAGATTDPTLTSTTLSATSTTMCVGRGWHPDGWIVASAAPAALMPGGCTAAAVQDVLTCLDGVVGGTAPDTAAVVAACLGGDVIDHDRVPDAPVPIADGVRNAFDRATGADQLGGPRPQEPRCSSAGIDPRRTDDHHPDGPGAVANGGFTLIKIGPFKIALERFTAARERQYDKVANDRNTAEDDAQYRANVDKLGKVAEATQVDVPTPTGSGDGAFEVVKAIVNSVVEHFTKPAETKAAVAPPAAQPAPQSPDRMASGLTPCQELNDLLADCEATGWLSGDCQALRNTLDRCDPTTVYTIDGSACAERTPPAPTVTPVAPQCSVVAKPAPGGQGCERVQMDPPAAIESPTNDPCTGTNPYALTDGTGCVHEPRPATPPTGPGPGPDPEPGPVGPPAGGGRR